MAYDSGVALITTLVPLLLLLLVAGAVCGVIAMNMAKKRGLRHVPAFFAGFFGTIVSLLIIAVIPKQQ